MYLEPTATVNLGLLLFFAQEDIRYIPKVELKISNPNGELIALLSTENVKNASVEVEFSLCHCGFRAKVVLDEEHWDEFIMCSVTGWWHRIRRGWLWLNDGTKDLINNRKNKTLRSFWLNQKLLFVFVCTSLLEKTFIM